MQVTLKFNSLLRDYNRLLNDNWSHTEERSKALQSMEFQIAQEALRIASFTLVGFKYYAKP
jgi:hypothetical protein